jgi:hypothetical protein
MEQYIDPEMDRAIANKSKDHIPGWGMDADPENDPTYPMKHRNDADYERIHYERAPQQEQHVELLKSIERPQITRVFGSSTPPAGISGAIRRYVFKYSEATATHWMGLILADRVNVAEGIINDLRCGKFPNLIAEWGWAAEWKYNRKKFVGRLVTRAVVLTAVAMLLSRKKKR